MTQHLFAYGTLQPGLAPAEIVPMVERLCLVGEGFLIGKLYDLGTYPGAVIDPAAEWNIYGTVYELPEDAEILSALDDYEGPQYVRIEQLVRLVGGGVLTCWVYAYQGRPNDDQFIASGRWVDRPLDP